MKVKYSLLGILIIISLAACGKEDASNFKSIVIHCQDGTTANTVQECAKTAVSSEPMFDEPTQDGNYQSACNSWWDCY